MPGFDPQLHDPARAGVFLVGDADIDTLGAFTPDPDLRMRRIDLFGVQDKRTVLLRIAVALDFPHQLGRSWDSLADALRDLQWLPARGYVLLFEGAGQLRERDPALLDTLLSVLDLAQRDWAARGVPFWAFLGMHAEYFAEPED
ncbi:MAG: barstar family protein [Pseudoxanthomonas sp.]